MKDIKEILKEYNLLSKELIIKKEKYISNIGTTGEQQDLFSSCHYINKKLFDLELLAGKQGFKIYKKNVIKNEINKHLRNIKGIYTFKFNGNKNNQGFLSPELSRPKPGEIIRCEIKNGFFQAIGTEEDQKDFKCLALILNLESFINPYLSEKI